MTLVFDRYYAVLMRVALRLLRNRAGTGVHPSWAVANRTAGEREIQNRQSLILDLIFTKEERASADFHQAMLASADKLLTYIGIPR